MVIKSFHEEFRFLSNFWPVKVTFEGMVFPSVEHAYQASKTLTLSLRMPFTDPNLTAGKAKRAGRNLVLRSDWESVKVNIMHKLVRAKFTSSFELMHKLIGTGTATLIEGNTWRDLFWGVDLQDGIGKNMLGQILMLVRDELRAERTIWDLNS